MPWEQIIEFMERASNVSNAVIFLGIVAAFIFGWIVPRPTHQRECDQNDRHELATAESAKSQREMTAVTQAATDTTMTALREIPQLRDEVRRLKEVIESEKA